MGCSQGAPLSSVPRRTLLGPAVSSVIGISFQVTCTRGALFAAPCSGLEVWSARDTACARSAGVLRSIGALRLPSPGISLASASDAPPTSPPWEPQPNLVLRQSLSLASDQDAMSAG